MTETVNHPAYYGGEDNPYEVIKVIEAWELDFHLGTVVKYIPRAGKKDPGKELEDLKKAAWYLARKIELVESQIETDEILADSEALLAIHEGLIPKSEQVWDDNATITVRYVRTGEDDPYPSATWTEYVTGYEFTEYLSYKAAGYFGREFPERYALLIPGVPVSTVLEEGIQLKDFAKPGDVLFLVER
jgi:hypothetical protein